MDKSKDFVHLHLHSQYSLLDGACRLEQLVDRAVSYNMAACAVTDHGNMFGAIEFYEEATKKGLKPIIGSEIYLAPGSRFDKTSHGIKGAGFHLVLLATNYKGYKNLMEIISTGFLEGFYYKPRVDKEVLSRCREGLIALSACMRGEVSHYLLSDQKKEAKRAAGEYIDIFGKDNFFLEIQDNKIPKQIVLNAEKIKLAKEMGLDLVATNDVHYLNRDHAKSHDALLCIQTQSMLHDTDRMKFATDQMYFKSPQEMYAAFEDIPEAVMNTVKVAEKCDLKLDFGHTHLPSFKAPEGFDNESFFKNLINAGIKKRYSVVTKEINERIDHEYGIIEKSGYISYFLIVWDFINKAKELGIPVGPGRGSAAGSIISYLIGITDIDPLKYNLIFERFLNPERVSMPDIDIDFCFERRNEVIDYVISKYSKDNVAQIITFGTMMAKGVIRDVGRVMGMAYADVDKIAKMVPNELGITLNEALEQEPELKALYESDSTIHELIDMSRTLESLNRHASTHAAGVVISDKPLKERIPLYKTADGQITTGYTMESLEKIGMLKIDFLGLKTLTVIDQTVKIVKRTRGIDIDIDNIPLDDKKAYELLCKGDVSGIFQLETSAGMRDLIRKIKPGELNDIIAILALYRPGPLGSGMVDEFIARKHGKIKVKYDHPVLESVLKETYGVIVYQEQVMKIVSILAGFTMSEADSVRKIMSKKQPEVMKELSDKFFKGTDKHRIDRKVAEKIFDQIAYFAGYGFNKSHSTGYAMISYRTAYLKANFLVEFMTALLTSERNNTDKIANYIGELSRMGIGMLPPDINESFRDFTVVGNDIRFGLVAVKNIGTIAVEHIIETRRHYGKFDSLYDFAEKIDSRKVNKKVIESLIKCGAFDSTKIHRSQAMAVIDKVLEMAQKAQKDRQNGQLSFFDGGAAIESFKETFHDVPDIQEWPEHELLNCEKEILGFYISKHPLTRYENILNAYSTARISELAGLSDGQRVLIGGLVNKVRNTVTRKKGEKMAIARLEDLENFVEVLVFPRVYQNVSALIKEDNLVYIEGKLNLREEEPKIVAENVIPLEKVRENFTKSVVVKLSTVGLEKEFMEKMKMVIRRHKGNVPLFIDLVSAEARKIRMSTDDDFSVIPSDELVKDMERLVGAGNVKFVTNYPLT